MSHQAEGMPAVSVSADMLPLKMIKDLCAVQDLDSWTLLGEVTGAVVTQQELQESVTTGDHAGPAWMIDQTVGGRTGEANMIAR